MDENLKPFVVDDTEYQTTYTEKFARRRAWTEPDPKRVTAYIPGVIQHISVRAGQTVRRGESLLVLEAMKMRNDVAAPLDGVIRAVHVAVGQMVPRDALLVEFE